MSVGHKSILNLHRPVWRLGTLAAALLILAGSLLPGCQSPPAAKTTVPRRTKLDKTAEQRKTELLKSLDQKFENPDAHCELARLYQSEGLWSKAEHHYSVALSFDPAHRPAQAGMVKLLADKGDVAKSELTAETYIKEASATAAGSLYLAVAFQKNNLDKYALACYQQAIELEPDSPEVNKQFGLYYLAKNDKAKAQEYLSRSFQLNPNQPDVARELGKLGVAVKIPRKADEGPKKTEKPVEAPPAPQK